MTMKINLIILLILFAASSMAARKTGKKLEFEWLNEDEEVFAIQDKEFPKSKRFSIDLSYVSSENQPYFDSNGFGASLSYYFNESFGLDFAYKNYNNTQSDDLESLVADTGIKPLTRSVDESMFLNADWTPFYGKVNLFNNIIYFDWGFGLGVGRLTILSNADTFSAKNFTLTFKEVEKTAVNVKTFFRFYVHKNINLGIQYDLTYFNAEINKAGTEETVNISDVSLIIGYMFL